MSDNSLRYNKSDSGIYTSSIKIYDFSKLSNPPILTRSSPVCECQVCLIAKSSFASTDNPAQPRNQRGRPAASLTSDDNIVQQPRPIRVCSFCLTEIQRGKEHCCTNTTRHNNILDLAVNTPKYGDQKIASSILRNRTTELES